MNEDDVRAAAGTICDALVAGDMERVLGVLSDELRRNPGEVLALLPLPATEASIASLERTASGYLTVLAIVGETDQVELEARWKDRDGTPRVVEVSHRSGTAIEAAAPVEEGEDIEATG